MVVLGRPRGADPETSTSACLDPFRHEARVGPFTVASGQVIYPLEIGNLAPIVALLAWCAASLVDRALRKPAIATVTVRPPVGRQGNQMARRLDYCAHQPGS
jgi:hypothetical protein